MKGCLHLFGSWFPWSPPFSWGPVDPTKRPRTKAYRQCRYCYAVQIIGLPQVGDPMTVHPHNLQHLASVKRSLEKVLRIGQK